MVRVCETAANLEGRISNYTSLTINGIKQAEKVKERLKSFNICSIYSSALDSSIETAEITAKYFNLPVIKCPEFNEIDLGDWDGRNKVDIANQYRSEWEEWINNPTENWRFPGARETLKNAYNRAVAKLKEIVSLHKKDDIICIVTHGNIVRVLLCFLLNIQLSNILKFDQFNGAITAFEYDSNKIRIQCINDCCHLHSLKFSDSITGKPWFIC